MEATVAFRWRQICLFSDTEEKMPVRFWLVDTSNITGSPRKHWTRDYPWIISLNAPRSARRHQYLCPRPRAVFPPWKFQRVQCSQITAWKLRVLDISSVPKNKTLSPLQIHPSTEDCRTPTLMHTRHSLQHLFHTHRTESESQFILRDTFSCSSRCQRTRPAVVTDASVPFSAVYKRLTEAFVGSCSKHWQWFPRYADTIEEYMATKKNS